MGWEMVKLGQFIEETRITNKDDDALPVYSVTKHNGFMPSTEFFNKTVHSKDLTRYKICNTNDWAYSTIHLDEGSLGFAPERCLISPMYKTFTVDETVLNREFLYSFLKSRNALKQYSLIGQGSVERRRSVKFDEFERVKIPLPPLEEQQRIATILGTVEKAITDATTILESTSALRQSVFKRFVRPGHPTRELGEIVSIQSGGTPSKKKPEYWGGDIPWYSPKDFKARYLSDSIDHITELAVSNANAKILPARTPAVVVRGMILAHSFPVAVLETPGAINQDVKALHLNEDSIYSVDFLAEALRANAKYALTKVLTSSHGTKRLETEELAKLPVPVMSKDAITEFDQVFSCLTELANYRKEKVSRLRELYASLSSRAFSGEL